MLNKSINKIITDYSIKQYGFKLYYQSTLYKQIIKWFL